MNKKDMVEYIESQKDILTDLSDKIWEYSETAFEEHKSMEAMISVLEDYGFKIERNVGNIETAFTASYGSGYPRIGILGEYDALSGLSQTANEFEKKLNKDQENTNGHGCGHNLLGVGSMAGAIGAKKYLEENNLDGEIIFFGCPAEEGGSGKTFMVRDGVFDDVDACLSWHPGNYNLVWTGSTLANYQVYFRFKGRSAHAAANPDQGRSALDAVQLMNMGVEFLREHVVQDARIHYAITDSGGFSPNVIPASAEVLYLMRAPKNYQVEDIYRRITNIAKGAALMTETEVEVDFVKACSELVPNRAIEEVLHANMTEIGYPELSSEDKDMLKRYRDTINVDQDELEMFLNFAKQPEQKAFLKSYIEKPYNDFIMPHVHTSMPMPGSTDVGDVSNVCPTSQIMVMTLASNTPGHSWQVVAQGKSNVAHNGMIYAGKVLASSAIDLFENTEKIEKAKLELKEKLGSRGYKNPIPKDVVPRSISK